MDTSALDRAEELPHPSLVGSLIRSADDAHNNYIHPEKSRPPKRPSTKHGDSQFKGALLDDLASEGALLTEEDYPFLGSKGEVLETAKYDPLKEKPLEKPLEERVAQLQLGVNEKSQNQDKEFAPRQVQPQKVGNNDNYLTPNLSEYQLDNNIADHLTLLLLVQSHDPQRLPRYNVNGAPQQPTKLGNSTQRAAANAKHDHHESQEKGGMHAPFFHTDREALRLRAHDRLRDRLGTRDLLSLRSTNKPHLARGDNYKLIHPDAPSNYELPAGLSPCEEDERQTRQERRTMLEKMQGLDSGNERDRLLVTQGDYTNFDVDLLHDYEDLGRLTAQRNLALANYLRLILRSRLRPAAARTDVKDEADPSHLEREGGLVSDDPYATIDNLESVVKDALSRHYK